LPGHGGSPGPAFDSVGDAAQWLGRFVETLGLGPCVLAGHSLGGAVAIRCASDFPDSACGLVCMSTGTQLPVPEGYMDVLSRDFAGAVCHSCASAYGASAPDALIRQGCDMLYRNGQETLCRDLRACAGFDGTAPAASLSAPALVLCGSDDALTPPDLSRDLCGRLPRAQLALVEGAGHMLMQEKPAECRSLIAGFVAGLLWAGSEVARV
jgi:pimeloyl-ACP methyl ester carboxylesterase